jgi:hypothetical protein
VGVEELDEAGFAAAVGILGRVADGAGADEHPALDGDRAGGR